MPETQHVYSKDFFDYISTGSRNSAIAVSQVLAPLFLHAEHGELLDVGCGHGIWTRELGKIPGVRQAIGVDGTYINVKELVIPEADFIGHDLTTPLNLERKFTLSLSLEVGEHLPENAAATLVKTLVDHADVVLFSAAIPGQGGESHINEQPLTYWSALFASHGYVPLDVIRPHLVGKKEVAPWYRYNTIMYVSKEKLADLPPELSANPVPESQQFASFASPIWKLRCAILRLLPRSIIELLALAKHSWVRRTRCIS